LDVTASCFPTSTSFVVADINLNLGLSGGRQLDFARSGIEILEEVVEKLKYHGHWGDHFSVLCVSLISRGITDISYSIDGGVRRAGDVLKAVALGAKAVGVGRPFL
jgi:L-lactate dehydrogenase (cytochrome)